MITNVDCTKCRILASCCSSQQIIEQQQKLIQKSKIFMHKKKKFKQGRKVPLDGIRIKIKDDKKGEDETKVDMSWLTAIDEKTDDCNNLQTEYVVVDEPREFLIVRRWLSKELNMESNSIRMLEFENEQAYIDSQNLKILEYSEHNLQNKKRIIEKQLEVGNSQLKKMVLKCSFIFCLAEDDLKQRLINLLVRLNVKPQRIVTFPHLLLLTATQLHARIKKLAGFFFIHTEIVIRGLRLAPQIVFYREERIKGVIEWLKQNSFDLPVMGAKIIQYSPGTLNYDRRRLDLYQKFLELWGVNREEIRDIFQRSIASASFSFLQPKYVAKFVFLQHYVGYSVPLILYYCPRYLLWKLDTRIAP
eukprot:TRINITY_DN13819_c3_g4_i1.p1 TRINITY_DN13819_c3_g4~~TRINITY_DN13819_c3_g4_i1.p1  ORF type:complete len:381 (+),score=24.19 TRINITY_DN13819_c3_g4_i1:65-1144(+)